MENHVDKNNDSYNIVVPKVEIGDVLTGIIDFLKYFPRSKLEQFQTDLELKKGIEKYFL
jgi:hypothetical protein